MNIVLCNVRRTKAPKNAVFVEAHHTLPMSFSPTRCRKRLVLCQRGSYDFSVEPSRRTSPLERARAANLGRCHDGERTPGDRRKPLPHGWRFPSRRHRAAGARVERTEQSITPYSQFIGGEGAPDGASLESTDLLPAGLLTYSATKHTKLRVAASRTLARRST